MTEVFVGDSLATAVLTVTVLATAALTVKHTVLIEVLDAGQITVGGNYISSSFGSSLEALIQMHSPIRHVPVGQLVEIVSDTDPYPYYSPVGQLVEIVSDTDPYPYSPNTAICNRLCVCV